MIKNNDPNFIRNNIGNAEGKVDIDNKNSARF